MARLYSNAFWERWLHVSGKIWLLGNLERHGGINIATRTSAAISTKIRQIYVLPWQLDDCCARLHPSDFCWKLDDEVRLENVQSHDSLGWWNVRSSRWLSLRSEHELGQGWNCEASFWKSMNNRCCAFAAPTAVFILRIALSSHCLLCYVRLLFYLVFHYLYVCAAWNNCNDQLMKRRMCWGAKQCKSWLQRQVCWKGKLVFFQVLLWEKHWCQSGE